MSARRQARTELELAGRAKSLQRLAREHQGLDRRVGRIAAEDEARFALHRRWAALAADAAEFDARALLSLHRSLINQVDGDAGAALIAAEIEDACIAAVAEALRETLEA